VSECIKGWQFTSPNYLANSQSQLNMLERGQQAKEAARCDEIIQFKPNGPDSFYSDKQGARAKPNERLKKVFGIDNAFTNPELGFKKDFTTKTEFLMKSAAGSTDENKDGDWSGLRIQAMTFFSEYMARKSDTAVDLAELTQYIVLKQSLCYLFKNAHAALESQDLFTDITFIGHRINELWIKSKIAETLPEDQQPAWEKETDLHKALRRVTKSPVPGGFDSDSNSDVDPEVPEANPMNFLLPAYETMWRVVLRCFLEIKHRGANGGPAWTLSLLQYLDDLKDATAINPTKAFHKPTDNPTETDIDQIRPVEIVKEALRLYPPTRRVHRVFDGQAQSADIETCQRFELLGGNDPLVYRPERWQSICLEARQNFYEQQGNYKTIKDALRSAEAKEGHMPFAHYCAADHSSTREFASKMIALLVAVLCHGLGDVWELEDAEVLPPIGTPLESDRSAYEKLMLKRKT